jgi:eukaryotic-like serine/threonine-protein kinase
VAQCPSCNTTVDPPSRTCPSCGTPLAPQDDDEARTLLADAARALPSTPISPRTPASSGAPATPSAAWLHSQASSESGLAPGTVIGGRYRIVGLLGRGGMGDVYRADDLLLGQPVALKFLPADLAARPDRLARFYGEVRLARQVSHPNVCRVYDVGEIEGMPFMSMEMVDGDDLASLLRRIGRLPEDKALDVARQLCAGLAAAHEKGVLHRDLKPANILIDARGKTRITDFGLAVLAETHDPAAPRAGTPAYMAPEQLARNEVSVQSDLYGLGVVLYEMFTGRRAYTGNTLVEVRRQHESSSLPNPSTVLEDLDPVIERAIMRCLEHDPRERPVSALAVAAALPCGDPLAAALAAGELPSPDLVAAAGGAGALRPALAWGALGLVAAGMTALLLLSDRLQLVDQVPLDKPPAVLVDRATTVLRDFGYTESPVDREHGFTYDDDYLRWIRDHDRSPTRLDDLRTGRPAAIQFWYRQHTQRMHGQNPLDGAGVSLTDPPLLASGMATVLLDPLGRLTDLYVVPPQVDSTAAAIPPSDWSPLFVATGLDPSQFALATPRWVPPVYCDTRVAWIETSPRRPDRAMRIEAGSYRGKPNYVQVIGPWTRADRMQPRPRRTSEKVAQWLNMAIILALLVGSILLARRSVAHGHGDRRGATRLAFYVALMMLGSWVFAEKHDANAAVEWNALVPFIGLALLTAAIYGVLYVGLEPVVRRRWPDSLISWNRLLTGRFRDPRVGRDLLLGLAAGTVMLVLESLQQLLPGWLGDPPAIPNRMFLDALNGFAPATALFLGGLSEVVFLPMALLFLLLLLRMLLRKPPVAAGALVVLIAFLSSSGSEYPGLAVVLSSLQMIIMLIVLLRLGLFAAIACNFVNSIIGLYYPLTADFSVWYAPATLFACGIVLACALYGFRTSLAGAPLAGVRLAVD